MTEPTLDEQMQKLETYEKGFLAVHLVNIGVQLGIFDNLKAYDSGITSKALATEMRLHEPYLRVWCQTAHYVVQGVS